MVIIFLEHIGIVKPLPQEDAGDECYLARIVGQYVDNFTDLYVGYWTSKYKKNAICILQGLVSFDSYIRAPQEGDVEKNMLARYCKVEVAEIVTNISSTKQSWSYNLFILQF